MPADGGTGDGGDGAGVDDDVGQMAAQVRLQAGKRLLRQHAERSQLPQRMEAGEVAQGGGRHVVAPADTQFAQARQVLADGAHGPVRQLVVADVQGLHQGAAVDQLGDICRQRSGCVPGECKQDPTNVQLALVECRLDHLVDGADPPTSFNTCGTRHIGKKNKQTSAEYRNPNKTNRY